MIPSRPWGKESVNAIVSKEYHHPHLMFNVQVQPSFHLTSALAACRRFGHHCDLTTAVQYCTAQQAVRGNHVLVLCGADFRSDFRVGPDLSWAPPDYLPFLFPLRRRGTVQRGEDLFVPSGKKFVPSSTFTLSFPLVRLMSPTVPPVQVRCQTAPYCHPHPRSAVRFRR